MALVTQKQKDDIRGFVQFAKDNNLTHLVEATIGHDLNGIVNDALCFCPRTSGYAKYLKD